jgi:hypothetical protein
MISPLTPRSRVRWLVLGLFGLSGLAPACDCGLEPLASLPDEPERPKNEEPHRTPTGAVEGRVCSPDGATWLGGATISIETGSIETGSIETGSNDTGGSESGAGSADGVIRTLSDFEGRFRLEDVPAGPHVVLIEKGSFASTREVFVEAGLTVSIPEDECQLDHAPRIAVVRGSLYDNVEAVLTEIGVEAETVDAYGADWAERLLGSDDGIADYDILFLNCRSNEATYAQRPDMQQRLRDFVFAGGSLHASDQAYDLIELTFPDKIDFLGDDNARGAADQGAAVDLYGRVLDPVLAHQLSTDTVEIHFGLATWSVMTGAAPGVDLYMQGDAPLIDGGLIRDAPLIVGFDHGDGRVVYSSFHQEPGIGQDQENVLKLIMFEL